MNKKILIVGQGLAGTLLAHHLLEEGTDPEICDIDLPGAASRAAEGIINPILLKWYSLSWKEDLFIPFAFKRYEELELKLKTRFLGKEEILKVFHDANDLKLWNRKSKALKYLQPQDKAPAFVDAPEGVGTVRLSGVLNTTGFLDASREFFMWRNIITEEKFTFKDLDAGVNQSVWKGKTYDFIIFCEGAAVSKNPYFNYLPLNPAKGETLNLQVETHERKTVNKRLFLVALPGSKGWMAGATYDWNNMEGITEEARTEMEEKLNKLLLVPYQVTGHNWGVRPAVSDRRPLLGRHPDYPSMVIFNGLGSKGISLSPYLSGQLGNHLLKNGTLFPEVDIKRFSDFMESR